jgi:hypothetical protein
LITLSPEPDADQGIIEARFLSEFAFRVISQSVRSTDWFINFVTRTGTDAFGDAVTIHFTILIRMTAEDLTGMWLTIRTTLSIVDDGQAFSRFAGFGTQKAFIDVRLSITGTNRTKHRFTCIVTSASGMTGLVQQT